MPDRAQPEPAEVIVTRIDILNIPFGDMVAFSFKLTFAMFPLWIVFGLLQWCSRLAEHGR